MPTRNELGAKSHDPTPKSYLVRAREGEHLIHFRDGGDIFIKVGPSQGSRDLAIGTQQLPKGSGIPVHRHLQEDEAFYVLEGRGTVTLDGVIMPCNQGETIFIPRNTWHGFSSADQEMVLLWIVAPPGLDGFFRETCTRPGEPPKRLTREQINAIAVKYGSEYT